MKLQHRFLFGPLAAVLLTLTIVCMPWLVPGYSSTHQTVSEIGESGSPMQIPFTVMGICAAACVLVFAWGLHRASQQAGHFTLAAYLSGAWAVSLALVSLYSFPHPLHGQFGLSQLVGYQAPLALAITWSGDRQQRPLVVFSWVMGILMWVALAANMSVLDRDGALWAYERPFYGLVQRSLFAVMCLWYFGAGVMLLRAAAIPPQPLLHDKDADGSLSGV